MVKYGDDPYQDAASFPITPVGKVADTCQLSTSSDPASTLVGTLQTTSTHVATTPGQPGHAGADSNTASPQQPQQRTSPPHLTAFQNASATQTDSPFPEQASTAPPRTWGMPSPATFCMNVARAPQLSARSFRTLAAHLQAKGFGGAPDAASPHPAARAPTAPPWAPTAVRHSTSRRSNASAASAGGAGAAAEAPVGSPHRASYGPLGATSLTANSTMSWQWHDASSQVTAPSPHATDGGDSDFASDDMWRDVIAEGDIEGSVGSNGDRFLSHDDVSDAASDASDAGVTSAAAGLGGIPRPQSAKVPRAPPLPPRGVRRSGHSAHTPTGDATRARVSAAGATAAQSWEESVHMAQASVAADDLAHAHGADAHPALRAFARGKLSFAFSGGGFFFPYHLG